MTAPHSSFRTRVGVSGVVAALLATTAACGGSSSETAAADTAKGKGAVTIGYSPPNQSAELLIGLGHGLQGYAKTKGAEVAIADPNNNPTTQVQQLMRWIELGKVQAIWSIPLNAASLAPVIAKARAKGVAVLATGEPSDYGLTDVGPGLSFSHIDYEAYGRSVGSALGECANERLDGKAQAILLPSPPGAVGNDDFKAGVTAGLAETSPGSKITATVDSQNDRLKSQQGALSAIQANPDINASAGQNDEGTLGALGALTQAGKSSSETCAVGAGGNKEALAAVKSGKLYADAALQFEADLAQNVDKMLAMVKNPKEVGTKLSTPIKVVRK